MKHLYLLLLILPAFAVSAQTIATQTFASGFTDPTEIANAGDDRLFVVQQNGLIRIVNSDGTINSTPFLNVGSLISGGSERGLLGLAFHPDYATNGYFYINYTNTSGSTVISRYSVSSNPNVANTSGSILLTIPQPFSNHNGGTIRFGPDGYLYIGMGDGGSGGDPQNNGQNKNSLLGKMLRIDVNGTAPYSSPSDNPYFGATDGADEIWATGLRNPWKFSFDSETGDLWIADVGQNDVEEINKIAGSTAGVNYGWRCYEGNAAYNTGGCAAQSTMTFPFAVYSSASGSGACSVTGGYVYRGTAYPNFTGKYFFADYCSDKIGMVDNTGTITWSSTFANAGFTTFGVNSANELFALGAGTGVLYKVYDSSLGIDEKPKLSFSLYPNPGNGNITLDAAAAVFPVKLSLYDINGRTVLQSIIPENKSVINTAGVSAGVYVVSIEDSTGSQSTSKLAVN